MKSLLQFLSDSEIEMIHNASMSILNKTGIRVHSESVLKIFAASGAKIEGNIVKLPPALVAESIEKIAEETVVLGAANPQWELELNDQSDRIPYTSPSGYSPYCFDLKTGQKRETTSADLVDFARVCEALDVVDFFWPIVVPTDQPGKLEELTSLALALKHTGKHVQCSCTTEKTARWQIEIAAALCGGEEALKRKPLFSAIAAPLTPLTFERGTAEAIATLAGKGIPVATMSVPVAGSTAPVTLAGTLALCNAEQLASLTLIKCVNASAPMIYAAEAMPMECKTVQLNYAAPEYPLLSAGCAQMARFYKLPSIVSDIPLEVMPGDPLAFERNVLKVAMSYQSRSTLAAWLGSMELALSASLAQLMIDAEACAHARAYLGRYDVNEESLALDLIDKAGPGGNFLAEEHTALHFKKELWLNELNKPIILEESHFPDYAKMAVATAESILDRADDKPLLDEEMVREIDRILVEAGRDILGC